MPDLDRDRSLVRGVSNHGAAPSFETGATRGSACRKRVGMRPPQDEAEDERGQQKGSPITLARSRDAAPASPPDES